MHIDDAIKCLRQAKARGTRDVIMAMWEADAFGQKDDDSWHAACELVDDQMDWADTHDCLTDLIAQREDE